MAWPFSVLILTLNEEANLGECLASVRECADIVVLDSGSTDRTVEIARLAGARVFTRAFDSFAGQRNFAQREIPFRNRWVFHLDADETMTEALAADCASAVRAEGLEGFLVAPRMIFEGRWIPHCTDFPAWQARFVRAPEFAFVDAGHGQREADHMRLGKLASSYRHDLSRSGKDAWLAKHRRYAVEEARAALGGSPRGRLRLGALLSKDPLIRRRSLKSLSHFLPFRAAARFFYQFVLRRGFLDGGPGFRYCLLLARYEGFIASESRTLRRGIKDKTG